MNFENNNFFQHYFEQLLKLELNSAPQLPNYQLQSLKTNQKIKLKNF